MNHQRRRFHLVVRGPGPARVVMMRMSSSEESRDNVQEKDDLFLLANDP